MGTEIIKLYDNENYEYSMVRITEGYLDEFKKDLNTYREDEEYNVDDFFTIVEDKEYFVEFLDYDHEVFF